MINNRKFLKCNICGNIITMVHDAGVMPSCCGKPMEELIVNTSDGAKEKHVPMGKREENKLTVEVGSVAHPMGEEHHIAWIAVAQGNKTQIAMLEHTGEAKAEFLLDENESVTIYEYCNLHGLWGAELE